MLWRWHGAAGSWMQGGQKTMDVTYIWDTPGAWLSICHAAADLPLQVNVLGPFALTQQLRPLLRAAEAARVVNVASVMHRRAALPPNLNSFFTCASVEPYIRQSFADTVEQPYPCTASGATLQCSHVIDQWFKCAVQDSDILHCKHDLEAVQGYLLTMGRAAANTE